MKERNRGEEGAVSLDYLEKLHKYHEDVFINNQAKLLCPVQGGTHTRYLTVIEVANHSQNGRPAGSDGRAF
jgi:hypothetical protein